ncbi:hypothetical protein [Natronospora cellulosivora (SeqCode)]
MGKERFILYIQFLTMSQNEKVFTLLEFPDVVFKDIDRKVKAKIWSMGTKKYKNTNDINKIIEWVKKRKLNELKINYEFESIKFDRGSINITDAQSLLTMSPTNNRWSLTNGYTCKNNSDERKRLSYESMSQSLKWSSIKIKPSIYEIRLQINSIKDINYIYKWVYNLLLDKLKILLLEKGISAYISVRNMEEAIRVSKLTDAQYLKYINECPPENEYTMLNIINRLAPYPKVYPLLGKQFAFLYPMLIGNYKLCKSVKEALGNEVKLSEIKNNCQEKYGLLWIPDNILKDNKKRKAAMSFLVKQNECMKKRKAEDSIGEFKLKDNSIYFTQKRHRELVETGIIEEYSTYSYILMLDSKYCNMIGINPDDMIINLIDNKIVNQLKEEIKIEFNKLSNELDIKKRIWNSHEKVWFKYFRSIELIQFIKERYFCDI